MIESENSGLLLFLLAEQGTAVILLFLVKTDLKKNKN